MRKRVAVLASAAMLPGCAIGVVLGVVSALSDAGQLVCKADTAYKAMYDTQGDAILAQGATATAVSDVCALVGGTPAPLPAARCHRAHEYGGYVAAHDCRAVEVHHDSRRLGMVPSSPLKGIKDTMLKDPAFILDRKTPWTAADRMLLADVGRARIVSGDSFAYDTATLLEVIYSPQNQPGLDGFWLQFYPRQINSDSEKIYFDEMDLNEFRLAPFVAPNVQGRVMRGKGFSTRSFRPAYAKPKHVVDPSRTITRMAGERITGSLTREERFDAIVADNMRRERAMHENLWDWMACQGIVTGQVIVAGDDYPSVTVSFNRDPRLTYINTGASLWTANTATPMADIQAARNLSFVLSRAPINTLVFGLNAWAAFLLQSHTDVQYLLNAFRRDTQSMFNSSNINTGQPFQYQGNIVGTGGVGRLDLYTYSNFYEDYNGIAQLYMDSGTVVGIGGAIEGIRAYGAIMDRRAGLQPLSMFPKMWDEEDPSVTYTMTQGAPLMVPVRANNTFSIKVA
jgi:hypothetical protein